MLALTTGLSKIIESVRILADFVVEVCEKGFIVILYSNQHALFPERPT